MGRGRATKLTYNDYKPRKRKFNLHHTLLSLSECYRIFLNHYYHFHTASFRYCTYIIQNRFHMNLGKVINDAINRKKEALVKQYLLFHEII